MNVFWNHKLLFKHKRFTNKTTLSSYVWHLKSVSSETTNLKWSVLRCVPQYSNISKKCLLHLFEKLETVTYENQKELLSKRSKLLCKYRYANKFLLKNYTSIDFRYVVIVSSRKKLVVYVLIYVISCKNWNKMLLPDDSENLKVRLAIN